MVLAATVVAVCFLFVLETSVLAWVSAAVQQEEWQVRRREARRKLGTLSFGEDSVGMSDMVAVVEVLVLVVAVVWVGISINCGTDENRCMVVVSGLVVLYCESFAREEDESRDKRGSYATREGTTQIG